MPNPLPRVLIVGGGFGGLYAAKALRRVPVQLTLVDRRNFHLFQPLLYQVASGGLSPGDIASPLRAVLKNHPRASVLNAEVVDILPEQRRVLLREGALEYDYLVVAALCRDFRRIEPAQSRITLIEHAARVLPHYVPQLSAKAGLALEKLGVQLINGARVEVIDEQGVVLTRQEGSTRLEARTVLWAAGMCASPLGALLGIEFDNKFMVLFQWGWNYFTRKRGARLITGDQVLPRPATPASP